MIWKTDATTKEYRRAVNEAASAEDAKPLRKEIAEIMERAPDACIVIEIEGGAVQVVAGPESTTVVIIDIDNLKAGGF